MWHQIAYHLVLRNLTLGNNRNFHRVYFKTLVDRHKDRAMTWLLFVTSHGRINTDEIGGACGMRERQQILRGFVLENLKIETTRKISAWWQDNIKINVKEIRRNGVEWIHLAKYSEYLEGFCERSNNPLGFINCVEFLDRFRNCWVLKKGFAAWNCFLLPYLLPFYPCFWYSSSLYFLVFSYFLALKLLKVFLSLLV